MKLTQVNKLNRFSECAEIHYRSSAVNILPIFLKLTKHYT